MSPSNIIDLSNFDYQSVTVDNLKYGDNYSKINLQSIEDIYVGGEKPGMSLQDKYNELKSSKGFIHVKDGLSLEIDNGKIKSMKLKDKFIERINFKTRQEVENNFGKADKELMDGTTWVTDYVVDSNVLVYSKLNLYIHIDPATDEVKEIQFGDVEEGAYD